MAGGHSAPEGCCCAVGETNARCLMGCSAQRGPAACHHAALSPTLIELPDAQIERALLAVAAGAGMAVLPESVAERYAAAGVRFVPLAGEAPVLATAVVSRRDVAHMPAVAFLRAVSQTRGRRVTDESGRARLSRDKPARSALAVADAPVPAIDA